MFQVLANASHATALGNAKRSMASAERYIQSYSLERANEIKVASIGYVCSYCEMMDCPSLLDLYTTHGLQEPYFSDPDLTREAHETTKTYIYGPKDETYFLELARIVWTGIDVG